MKIPKYIEDIIRKRAEYSYKVGELDRKLVEWLNDNEIETEAFDTLGGVEMYSNPYDSAERIREAILIK